MEDIHVGFYRIQKCGHYKRGEPDVPVFGGLVPMLNQLRTWATHQAQLSLTKTFEESDDGAHLPLYLVDLSESEGTWLMTLWNEVPSTAGAMASIDGESPVGAGDVTMSEFPNGGIPGFATYFWFLPENHLIVSVRFQHTIAGHGGMRTYLSEFMKSYSGHVVYDQNAPPGTLEVVGYKASPHSPLTHHQPRFWSEVARAKGSIAVIRANAPRIRKIVRRTILKLNQKRERAYWQRAYDLFKLTTPVTRPEVAKVNYEMEVSGLTTQDVDRVFTEWSLEAEDSKSDYGFVISGNSDVLWLGHSNIKYEFSAEIARTNAELVSPASLLAALINRRVEILAKVG